MIHDPPDEYPHPNPVGLQWGATTGQAQSGPIAPWGHTLAVLAVLGFLSVSGYLRAHATPPASDYLLRLLSAIVSQVLLTGAVIAGVYQRGRFFQTTLLNGRVSWAQGRAQDRAQDWAQDWAQDLAQGLLVYMGGMILVLLPGMLAGVLHMRSPDRSLLVSMLPHAWWHMLPWLGVSLCAGLGEELVFRGYLLQQAAAWLGSARWAIVLTSVLFGVMHAYEGWIAVLSLTLLAGLYAVVTMRSGHLRAAVIAHTLQDLLTAAFFLWRHHPL
jgi:membrane protease YdiL (CAAX protease family)